MTSLRQGVLELADKWASSARASAWLVDRAEDLRTMVAECRTDASEREVEQLLQLEKIARVVAGYTVDDCDDDYQAAHAALEKQLEHLDEQRRLDAL